MPTFAEIVRSAEAGMLNPPTPEEEEAQAKAIKQLLEAVLGEGYEDANASELLALVTAANPPLQRRFVDAAQRAKKQGNAEVPLIALRRHALRLTLSEALSQRLIAMQPPDALGDVPMSSLEDVTKAVSDLTPAPTFRSLRAFAFDPSLATRLETVSVNQVTIRVPFEADLKPGPVGEYLAVIDVDPASKGAYLPVDLNHPSLLAQDGLPWSEGNPQFHQQMVYAVAMKTIRHFEEALGRPIFWSPLRPWKPDSPDRNFAEARLTKKGKEDLNDQFVQHLRLYPHALRDENAYYSPQKRAILFGYFPARSDDPGVEYPEGIVFTCLSHDIIAHEMTHAVLDGMHSYFTEPTNPDVYAFHEAFADIIALFQHFTYPEVLRHELAKARGELSANSLLVQLAQQFGYATGRHQALRNALGSLSHRQRDGEATENAGRNQSGAGNIEDTARDPEKKPEWKRYQADPELLPTVEEAHSRGAILVAAMFDAYLALYSIRTADLVRIATGGRGILPAGQMHPDLVNRMADEAADCARHVLHMNIRAMDCVPPVDITFGEFLRALITADYDINPDQRQYRVAFIEAFRKWGIYPRDVRTLSEESLRWRGPQKETYLFPRHEVTEFEDFTNESKEAHFLRVVRYALLNWEPGAPRDKVFDSIQQAQGALNSYLWNRSRKNKDPEWTAALLHDLDPTDDANRFSVSNLRPARRVGQNGEFRTEMVFEVVQKKQADDPKQPPFRGGVTVVVSLDDWKIRYIIHKGLKSASREKRQREYEKGNAGLRFGAAEYSCGSAPDDWEKNRAGNIEAMRASSCACRRKSAADESENALREPFALLHRGDE